jgi:hypothetical protein
LAESDHYVLVKTALPILLVRKVDFCEHRIWLLIPLLCYFMDIQHFHSAWV